MSTAFDDSIASKLSSAVELDASIAILMDPTLHSFSFCMKDRDELQRLRSEHTQTQTQTKGRGRGSRPESLLYGVVRANIHSAEELSAYETIVADACNRGFSGCSSSCTSAYKEMYVNYMIVRLRFIASSFNDFISAERSRDTCRAKWDQFSI